MEKNTPYNHSITPYNHSITPENGWFRKCSLCRNVTAKFIVVDNEKIFKCYFCQKNKYQNLERKIPNTQQDLIFKFS